MAARGGFVTGAAGMGHVAVTTTRPHQVRGYYNTVFDARLTDYIDETISGLKFKIRFLRVNERHHSVAIAAVNRMPTQPDPHPRTASQHPGRRPRRHDRRLPTGQGTRLSHGARCRPTHQRQGTLLLRRDARRDSSGRSAGIRSWSTKPPGSQPLIRESASGATRREGQTIVEKFAQFKTGAASLLRDEDVVPALAGAGIPDH